MHALLKIKYCLLVALVVWSHVCTGQEGENPHELKERADSLRMENRFNLAGEKFDEASRLFEINAEYDKAIESSIQACYSYLFNSMIKNAEQAETRAVTLASHHLPQDSFYYYKLKLLRASFLYKLRKFEESYEILEALEKEIPRDLKHIDILLRIYDRIIDIDESSYQIDRLAKTSDKIDSILHHFADTISGDRMLSSLNSCASCWMYNRDFIKALEYNKRAEKIIENNKDLLNNSIVVTYYSKSRLLGFLDLPKPALEALLKTLPITSEENKKYLYLEIGNVYLSMQQAEKAVTYFDKAYRAVDESTIPRAISTIIGSYLTACAHVDCDSSTIRDIESNLYQYASSSLDSCRLLQSLIYQKSRRIGYIEQATNLEKAQSLSQRSSENDGNKRYLDLDLAKQWSYYYTEKGDYQKALAWLDRSIEINSFEKSNVTTFEGRYAEALEICYEMSSDSCARHYFGQWQTGVKLDTTSYWKDLFYFNAAQYMTQRNNIDSTLYYYDLASIELSQKLLEMGDRYDLISTFEQRDEDIDRAISFLSSVAKDHEDLLFRYHELRRAYALRRQMIPDIDLIVSEDIADITSAILEKEGIVKYLKREIGRHEGSKEELEKLQEQLLNEDQKLDLLRLSLKEDFPVYADFINQQIVSELPEAVQYAKEHNLSYISYDMVNDSTVSLLMVAPDGQLTTDLIHLSYDLSDQLSQVHEALVSSDAEQFFALSYPLYQNLVAPYQDQWSDHIMISSSGILQQLNFEFLPMNSNPASFQDMSYIIESYTISQVLSFSQMQLTSRFANTSKREMVVFVPGFLDGNRDVVAITMDGSELSPQEQSVETGKEIINLFPDAEGYFEEEATKQNFIDAMQKSGIIHVSSHAFYDEQDPYSSYIQFSAPRDSMTEGELSIDEIYRMESEAGLAVLLGCETGLGEQLIGEGIASLAHAMNYTGCPTQVFTRWKVDELASNKIIYHFYEQLAAGENYSEALRAAKLEFMHQEGVPQYANPYYWGGIVMMGSREKSLFGNSKLWWFGAGALGLVALLIVRRFTRR